MNHTLKQLLKGTLAGGVAIFVAHGIGWATPLPDSAIKDFNTPAALSALQGSATEPGTYFVNAGSNREGLAVSGAPWGWMTLHSGESYATQQSGAFLRGLIINFIWALLASLMVLASRARSFSGRFAMGVALALFGLFMGPIWDWSWGWYSARYALAMGVNTLLGFVAMAAVVAWLVKPAPAVT